jgi:TatD DNase family protein
MLADTHCHLDFPEFNPDREEVIARARSQDIDFIVNIGSSLAGSRMSLELARRHDFIYASIGLHPHEADKYDQNTHAELVELAKHDKVVAIGEIGLDYYRNYSKAENQKQLFLSLLKLAKDMDLPVIIHNRLAQQDTLMILKEYLPLKAVVHCFSGDEIFLRECLNSGFFVSFTCNITYKKADNLRGLVDKAPLERLFLETDAPFLPPEGFRGRRNEPVYVKFLAQEIARIKGVDIQEVARITTENAKIFFNIKCKEESRS